MVQSPPRTNPFPGLRPFELDEEHLFFGREGQADELLRRLNRTRFLAVVGTSGSGKSSLVRAGLLPSLYSGFLQDASSGWRVAILRPGSSPIANLAEALNDDDVFGVAPNSDDAIIRTALTESTLRRGSLGLVEVIQQARMEPHEALLVVVDQFEEIFRFKQQAKSLAAEDEAAAFVKLLLSAVEQREVPIFVVLTMRSDFLGDCAQFMDLPEALNDSQYLIPRLTRNQLRKAIEGPVAVGGGTITPRLVNRLLNDTGDNPDQLPILQHALMRTWDYWEDQSTPQAPIDLEHYEAIGGMAQALSLHADQIYQGLPDDRSRQLAETLFRCLTDRGADNREIRRPTQLAEICAVAHAKPEEMIPVIDEFRAPRRSFLMPPSQVPLTDTSVLDVSHESLMRNWQRLQNWIDTEFRSATIFRRLAETAKLNQQGRAGFLRDPELTIGLTWRKEQQPNAAWAERYADNHDEAIAFLMASSEAAAAEAAEKERTKRREVNRLRTFLGLLTGLTLLTGGVAVYAFQQQQEAKVQTRLAQEQERVAEGQKQIAEEQRQIAEEQRIEAQEQEEVALGEKVKAEKAQKEAENQKQEAEKAQTAEAEQRQLAEEALQRAQAGEAEANRQTEIARLQTILAEENATAATTATQEAERERRRAEIQAVNSEIRASALSAENLLSSGLDLKALISALSLGQEIAQIEGAMRAVASSKSLASSNDETLLANLIQPSARMQAISVLREVIYAPGWKEKNTFRGHSEGLAGVSYSPDGKLVATASYDNNIKLWDLSGREIQTLEGHTEGVNQVVFSTLGDFIASSSNDGTVRIWDTEGRNLQTFYGHMSWVEGLGFSPDGKALASGGGDDIVRLWNVLENLEQPAILLLEEGELTEGELLEERATFFEDHSFQGEAGQKIFIKLESQDFDTFLQVLDSEGNIIAENDDAFGRNSAVNLPLPSNEEYRIIVTSYEAEEIGKYTLTVAQDFSESSMAGHTDDVLDVSFSPDGRNIATASDDGTARLWDLKGNQVEVFEGHAGGLNAVKFNPDGKLLVTASDDDTARIWDLNAETQEPGTVILDIEGLLTSENVLEARGTYYTVHEFEAVQGQTILTRLESEDFDTYLRIENQSGEILAENDDNFGLNSGLVVEIPESGVYKIIVTTFESEEQGAYTLSAKTDLPGTALEGHTNDVQGISFHPNGNRIVTSAQDATLRLWDLNGRELQVLKGHADFVNDISFSPSGEFIASVSGDRTLKLWGRSDSDLQTLEGHTAYVRSVSFSPDGQTIASTSADSTVKLWDLSGRELQTLEGHSGFVRSVSFSPDGQTIASTSADSTVKLWNRSGQELATLEGHTNEVNSVSFAPDGQTIASASDDGTVKLWDLSGRELQTLEGHTGSVNSVSFAPDGQTIASASADGTVKLWDLSGRELQTLEGHTGSVWSVSFAPDGQTIASASSDGTVKLWNLSGRELQTLEGHTGSVLSVSFAPVRGASPEGNGQTIASASDDGTVKLWDLSGRELQTLEGHTGSVLSVSFAPDGQTIASASDDGTVILWNFNLDDLIAKSCDWLRDYMANPATPPEEKALCKDELQLSGLPTVPERVNWVANVRGFWRGVFGEG
jgi:WD40 repeat protein